MAYYRLQLVNSTLQTFNTVINNINYRFTVKFYPSTSHWTVDLYNVTEARWICQGQALSLGTPILWESAEPIVLFLTDVSSLGVDPSISSDMFNRIILWAADNDETTLRTFVPTRTR